MIEVFPATYVPYKIVPRDDGRQEKFGNNWQLAALNDEPIALMLFLDPVKTKPVAASLLIVAAESHQEQVIFNTGEGAIRIMSFDGKAVNANPTPVQGSDLLLSGISTAYYASLFERYDNEIPLSNFDHYLRRVGSTARRIRFIEDSSSEGNFDRQVRIRALVGRHDQTHHDVFEAHRVVYKNGQWGLEAPRPKTW